MKTRSLLSLLLGISCCSYAQQHQLLLQGTAAVPFQGAGFGAGGSLKYLARGNRPGLLISATAIRFADNSDASRTRTTLLMAQGGYRRPFGALYLEGALGIGALNGRVRFDGDYARPSVAAFTATLGGGYQAGRFSAGVGFTLAKGIEGPSAGLWHDRNFSYAGITAGYRIGSW